MKRIRSKYHILHAIRAVSPRLRKTIVENSDNGLVLVLFMVLNVLNGNCKAKAKRLHLAADGRKGDDLDQKGEFERTAVDS
jgi:hypothetical protein